MARYPNRPSRRLIAAHAAFHAGDMAKVQELASKPPRAKPKRQAESSVNDAVKDWARLRNGVLYRNRRGMMDLPNGGKLPIGLGPNGTGDLIGYMLVKITPELVGRTLPIYTELESKTESGRLKEHQFSRIEELRDAQAIAGCVRDVLDCEEILKRWRDGYAF